METIKDNKTGLRIVIPANDPGYNEFSKTVVTDGLIKTQDFPLIKWCEQYLTKDDLFVDIGCGIGLFSILLSGKCKEVWSFDSYEPVISCLATTASINMLNKIRYNNIALSSEQGTVTLYRNDNALTTNDSVAKMLNMSVVSSVKCKTLDSFNLQNIGLVNIDVDGGELKLLMGSMKTLMTNNFPPIVLKIRNEQWYNEQKELILAHLRNSGYAIHVIGGCENRYLASDHPIHKSLGDKKKSQDEKIIDLFNKQQTKSFTWYEWYVVAHHLRLTGRNQESYHYAHQALKCQVPEDKQYLIWEELSIVCCYINKKDEGYEASENVSTSKYAPFSSKNMAMRNQAFYMKALPFAKVITVDCELPVNYVASSSAIINDKDNYLLNVRAVNYRIAKEGYYTVVDPNNIINTRNYLLNLSSDLKTVQHRELIDNSKIIKHKGNIQGNEDLRLFAPGEFFCTSLEVNKDNVPQMCYGQFTNDGVITNLTPLQVTIKLQCEKNWLPFYVNNVLHVIYSVAPLCIYSLDTNTGVLKLVKQLNLVPDKNIEFFRGSAPPIRYRNGWLATVHQVYHDKRRMYFHRFIWFDDNFSNFKYSKVFFFESPNIEYNLSICHSPQGLLMPYSVNDACSKIGVLPYEVLDTLI